MNADRLVNVCIVVMTLSLIVLAATNVINRGAPSGPTGPRVDTFEVGDTFDLEIGLDSIPTKRWLVLVVRSTCAYCSASMPFYSRLTSEAGSARKGRVGFVALTTEDPAITGDYLTQHQVVVDSVARYPPTAYRFRGTPTLVALDANRRVIGVWEGKLDPEGEAEVRSVLGISSSND